VTRNEEKWNGVKFLSFDYLTDVRRNGIKDVGKSSICLLGVGRNKKK